MVSFPFRIGKAFLDYDWHPVTIPKQYYVQLERESLAAGSVSIESPFGATHGSIYYSRAGYGPFYQIKMEGGGFSDPMTEFKLGQVITVQIVRNDKTVRVTLRA
jgi:hypothetical protein